MTHDAMLRPASAAAVRVGRRVGQSPDGLPDSAVHPSTYYRSPSSRWPTSGTARRVHEGRVRRMCHIAGRIIDPAYPHRSLDPHPRATRCGKTLTRCSMPAHSRDHGLEPSSRWPARDAWNA